MITKTITPIILIGLLVYCGLLSHNYLVYDDYHHFIDNPMVSTLSLANIETMFFHQDINDTYIPLTVLSGAIEYTLFNGYLSGITKMFNVLLHLLVTVGVFKLAIHLKFSKNVAWLAALIFCVHPIHVESIAWATERKDTLYSLFYIYSSIFYIKYLDTRNGEKYVLALLLGCLAILAKPMALSLPLTLLLIEWYHRKKVSFLDKVPFALTVFPIAAITWIQNREVMSFSWPDGLVILPWSATSYLVKFFLPVNLAMSYDFPVMRENIALHFFYVYVFIAVAESLFSSKNRLYKFAVLYYVLSIFFLWRGNYMLGDMIANRFMYLPCVGLCLFSSHHLVRVSKSKLGLALVTVLILILSIQTFKTCEFWKDSHVFSQVMYSQDKKNLTAISILGYDAFKHGDYELAYGYFMQGLNVAENDEDLDDLYYLRGRTLFEMGLFEEADKDFSKIKLIARNSDFASWKGYASLNRKDYDSAIKELGLALEIDPYDEDSQFNLKEAQRMKAESESRLIRMVYE